MKKILFFVSLGIFFSCQSIKNMRTVKIYFDEKKNVLVENSRAFGPRIFTGDRDELTEKIAPKSYCQCEEPVTPTPSNFFVGRMPNGRNYVFVRNSDSALGWGKMTDYPDQVKIIEIKNKGRYVIVIFKNGRKIELFELVDQQKNIWQYKG